MEINNMSVSSLEIPNRLKFFRKLRGMTQEDLSCASRINFGQIRKYESGERVPKLEQLEQIAKGMNISINTLMDFDVKSVGDVMSLLIKIDETAGITFSGTKNKDGSYDPKSIQLTFKNKDILERIAIYMALKDRAKKEPDLLLIDPDLKSPLLIEKTDLMLDGDRF